MRLHIISDTNRRVPRKKIMRLIEIIEDEEDPPDSNLNIIFTRDRKIRELNKAYRNLSKPTDVLSFNIDNEPGEYSIMGEIYISTDTAAKNASNYGFTFSVEILRLCCHGFLHILGYDHEKGGRKEKLMRSKEEYYLEKIN